mgnify:FL=1
MKIDIELATDIKTAIDNFDSSVTLHTDYSGRGMYGRKCFGVSGRGSSTTILMQLMSTLLSQAELTLVSFIEELAHYEINSDNLGYDTLIYWPDVEWPDLDEEEIEDEQQ